MIVGDFSPPASPTLEQQRDALRKGLGRAFLWARAGRLDADVLLDACINDGRYDHQCEDARGGWLWRLLNCAGVVEPFCAPLFQAMQKLADPRSANQLGQLAQEYAAAGDQQCRDWLYDLVRRKPDSGNRCLGEDELLALDGLAGFAFAAKIRGQELDDRDWDWDDDRLIREAVECCGAEQIEQLLRESSDTDVQLFRELRAVEERRDAQRPETQPRDARLRAISVADLIADAVLPESKLKPYTRGWGMQAEVEQLRQVLEYLWQQREPQVIANLLRVFSNRALPEFDSRLIELCRHEDDEVRRRARSALAKNAHPLIRAYALSELERGALADVCGLFVANYEVGDEQLIFAAFEWLADEDDLHTLLRDMTEVLEQHADADCSRLGPIIYALTPCALCRYFAVKLLHERQALPDWLRSEIVDDAEDDCAKLLTESPAPGGTC